MRRISEFTQAIRTEIDQKKIPYDKKHSNRVDRALRGRINFRNRPKYQVTPPKDAPLDVEEEQDRTTVLPLI